MTPVIYQPRDNSPSAISRRLRKAANPSKQRVGLSFLLIIGLMVLGTAGFVTWNWVRNLQIPINAAATPVPVDAFKIQRTVSYAGLDFTVVNAQYALSFADDTIRSGPAVVRLNMQVANKTADPVSLVYYDVARLIAPKLDPIAPTNVQLSTGPKPGTTETGWLDFPVSKGIQLHTLQLQIGSAALNETLATIPFSGSFAGNHYIDRWSAQSLTFSYTFHAQYGLYLTYHLVKVGRLYAYKGSQTKSGQQFYVFDFHVDNPNGTQVSPGFGFDYIRLVLGGNPRPPIDNTLPYGFKAGAHGVDGHVTFVAPAGLRSATLLFLGQFGSGGDNHNVSF